jgi:reactive intermediate/imine deaminase
MVNVIATPKAPAAIGCYSQAVLAGETLYLSGQIPLQAGENELISGDLLTQARLIFKNISEVCQAAGGSLNNLVKLTVYLTDLSNSTLVNKLMEELFETNYPARAMIEVSALPMNANIEIEAIGYIPFR